jgi:hypothetical protein
VWIVSATVTREVTSNYEVSPKKLTECEMTSRTPMRRVSLPDGSRRAGCTTRFCANSLASCARPSLKRASNPARAIVRR